MGVEGLQDFCFRRENCGNKKLLYGCETLLSFVVKKSTK